MKVAYLFTSWLICLVEGCHGRVDIGEDFKKGLKSNRIEHSQYIIVRVE